MKLLSLFSGIGAFEKALKNLNIDYELVGYSEIGKYASKAYSLIHGESESKNLGDITKINVNTLPKDIDMITYGFPCQDISIAGNQQGFFNNQGEKTRSGLFFNALNIIQAVHPKIAIAENVKNLTGKRFKSEFEMVLNSLCLAGYNNYYKVLNAKDYGIPQNRERVFIVSIRKDIDTKNFEFPEPIELNKRLKDLLEDDVDEKYYLKNTKMLFINNSFKQEKKGNGFRFEPHVKNKANCAKAITTRAGGRMDDNFIIDIDTNQEKFKFDSTNRLLQIGTLDIKGLDMIKRVYSTEGICPTINTFQGGNTETKIAIKKVEIPQTVKVRKHEVDTRKLIKTLREHKSYTCKEIASKLDISLTTVEHWFREDKCFSIPDADIWFKLKELLNIKTDEFDKSITEFEEKEGVFEKSNRCYLDSGLAPTLTMASGNEKVIVASRGRYVNINNQTITKQQFEINNTGCTNALTTVQKDNYVLEDPFKIRKLTPRECFRLMGFDDRDVDILIDNNISNTQLYKMAGNSICVSVLEYIFSQLSQSLLLDKAI